MIPDEYEQFCLTLNACMVAAGRAKPDKAAADVFWMKLCEFELSTVQWALVECTDSIDHGYQYNVRLIKKKIEEHLKVNKFREYAKLKIEQQETLAIEHAEYMESDEYKENQDAGTTFKDLRRLFNNV